MKTLVQEKDLAMKLRRGGRSYREILQFVHVSKSSLSAWLKDMPLTDKEKHFLKSRQVANNDKGRIRASSANHGRREERDKILFEEARREFKEFEKEPLFLIGIALYWAEGAKRNSYFSFTNSDPDMAILMTKWIQLFLKAPLQSVQARLFTHKPFAHENQEGFWAMKTGIPSQNFKKTIYKKHQSLVKKRPEYKGCLRIDLYEVKYLRKVMFWQQMLIEHSRKAG